MAGEGLEELRRQVLESWTLTADRVRKMTDWQAEGMVANSKKRDRPKTDWVPFRVLLDKFEEAVREDEAMWQASTGEAR